MNFGRSIVVFLIAFAGLVACKQTDDRIPVITFESPGYQQHFDVFDTVPVAARIEDEKELTTVRVNITDENLVGVTPAQVFYPGGPAYELKTGVHLEDEFLETGNYYVLIRAENGVAFKNQYLPIEITGLSKEYIQCLVVVRGSTGQLDLYSTTDFDSSELLLTLEGDYSASDISSHDKTLFVAGESSMNVTAIDLISNSVGWIKDTPPGNPIHNPGCLDFNELLYTTYNYQYVHGYAPNGNIGFDFFVEESDAPECIYRVGDFVLVEIQKKNGADPFISTRYASTGNEKQKRLIGFDVVDFKSIDEDRVVVVANRNDRGVLFDYDLHLDVLTEIIEIQDEFNTAVAVSDQEMVVAGNIALYLFNKENGILLSISDSGAKSLQYEVLSKSLIAAMGNKLDVYGYPEMVNQKTLLFSDTILNMHLQYSK